MYPNNFRFLYLILFFQVILPNGILQGDQSTITKFKKNVEVNDLQKQKNIISDNNLYYNVALSYYNLNNLEEAKVNVIKAVQTDPKHADSHLLLAQIYYKQKLRIPGLLVISRYLTIEPLPTRSQIAFQLFRDFLAMEVNWYEKMNLLDGDFISIDIGFALQQALRLADESRNKSEIEITISEFEFLFELITLEMQKEPGGFVWQFYAPYFSELSDRNFVEIFVNYIHRPTISADTSKWLQANTQAVQAFLNWSDDFKWRQAEFTRK